MMLSYDANPVDAGDYHEAIWKSGNENVARIENVLQGSAYVTVEAVGEGETDITLTLGDKTVTCHVTVKRQ